MEEWLEMRKFGTDLKPGENSRLYKVWFVLGEEVQLETPICLSTYKKAPVVRHYFTSIFPRKKQRPIGPLSKFILPQSKNSKNRWQPESNRQPAAYDATALPLSHASPLNCHFTQLRYLWWQVEGESYS